MTKSHHNRNFIYCTLAIKLGFLDQSQVREIVEDWSQLDSLDFAEYCQRQGMISAAERNVLDDAAKRLVEDQPSDTPAASLLSQTDHSMLLFMEALQARGISLADSMSPRLGTTQHFSIDDESLAAVEQRFRILRPLARGGLGEVYIANDSELNREVALKMIQGWHVEKEESRARFLLEAEVTGRLEHPGIVPVYSLGRDAKDRPYYAMRYIEGKNLKDAIRDFFDRERTLSPGERTLEFRQLVTNLVSVCQAASYAHSRGILHRDIKPSNIVLGKFGETILVDWGLAKVIGSDPDEELNETTIRPKSGSSKQRTIAGAAIGTPAFMSPEQAAGNHSRIDATADVYSLGATLYNILTGQSPFSNSTDNVLERVRNGSFPSPLALRPDLPKPLVSICLRAMATKRQNRYRSAKELAADLQCWLADEPVTAHAESMTSRLGRMYRHRRTLFHMAAGFFLLVAVGSAISATMIARKNLRLVENNAIIAKQRDDAAASFDDARTLALELQTVQEAELSKIPQQGLLRLKIATKIANAMKSFYDRDPTNPQVQNSYAKALRFAGNLNRMLGRNVQARESYDEALRLLEMAANATTDASQIREDWTLALVDSAVLFNRRGDLPSAHKTLQQAEQIAEVLVDASPNDSSLQRTAAYVSSELASSHWEFGRLEESLRRTNRAIELLQQIVGTPSEGPADNGLLLECTVRKIDVLNELKRWSDAIVCATETLRSSRSADEVIVKVDHIHQLARIRQRRAQLYLRDSHHKEAQADIDTAKAELMVLADEYRGVGSILISLCQSLSTSAEIHLKQQHLEPAVEDANAAVETLELPVKLSGALVFKKEFAKALLVRAQVRADNSQWLQAAADIDRCVALQQEIVDATPESNQCRLRLAQFKQEQTTIRQQMIAD